MTHDERIEKAKTLIGEGKLGEAAALLNAVLEARPADAFAAFELARISQLSGDDAAAEKGYRKTLDLNKRFPAARLELARIYGRQQRNELALEQYRLFLEDDPKDRNAYRELGRLCENTGSPERALEYLRRAAALSPDDPDVLFDLARSMREAGNEKEAAEAFRKVLAFPSVKNDAFLHNRALNELEITERKEVLESKPRAMIAMVIDRCNIHCRICHIWKGKWQARESVMKEIVGLFPYMEDICWEGGEIFLMPGYEDILAEGAKYPRLKQVIFTNGLLITEKTLEKIASGRADIVFSIDSPVKETYEHIRSGAKYERLVRVLELVRDFRKSRASNIDIYFNPVIMRSNHRQLEEMVEFGKRYGFNAITFTPIRGEFGDENIFEKNDEAALAYIDETVPRAIEKAREYGIRLNNWLPARPRPENKECGGPAKPEGAEHEQPAKNTGRMVCYAPWQRLTIDSGGPARPFAFCLNKFVGDTDRMSLADIWNGDGMREYRRRMARGEIAGFCQPECISGQVRDKICKVD